MQQQKYKTKTKSKRRFPFKMSGLPFKFTFPLFKDVVENGKSMRLHLGKYFVMGFTRKRGKVDIDVIQVVEGEVKMDLKSKLHPTAPDHIEEIYKVTQYKVDQAYFSDNNMQVVR